MASYWVNATSGNDSNVGSQGSPFLTLAKALTVVVTGDVVNLTAETHSHGAPITNGDITIQTVTGAGSNAVLDFGNASINAIQLTNANGFRLERVTMRNLAGSAVNHSGTCNGVRYVSVTVESTVTDHAIQWQSGSSGTDNLIVNPDFTGSGAVGMDGVNLFGSVHAEIRGGHIRGYTGSGSDGITTHETATLDHSLERFEGAFYGSLLIENCEDGAHYTNTDGTSTLNGVYVRNCIDSCIKQDGGVSAGGDSRLVVLNSVAVSNSASASSTSNCLQVVNYGRMTARNCTLDNQNDSGTAWAVYLGTSNNSSINLKGCVFVGTATNNYRYARFADATYTQVEAWDYNAYLTKSGAEFNNPGGLTFADFQLAGFDLNSVVGTITLTGDVASALGNAVPSAGVSFGAADNLTDEYTALNEDILTRPRPPVATIAVWDAGAYQRQVTTKLVYGTAPDSTANRGQNWDSFTVELQDASDNRITYEDQEVTVSLATGAGTLSGTLTRETSSGVAVFNDIQHDTDEAITIDVAAEHGATGISGTAVAIGEPVGIQESIIDSIVALLETIRTPTYKTNVYYVEKGGHAKVTKWPTIQVIAHNDVRTSEAAFGGEDLVQLDMTIQLAGWIQSTTDPQTKAIRLRDDIRQVMATDWNHDGKSHDTRYEGCEFIYHDPDRGEMVAVLQYRIPFRETFTDPKSQG